MEVFRLHSNSMIITEQELISRLQSLKQVKPRQEWVILTKSQILGYNREITKERIRSEKAGALLDFFFSLSYPRKLAYALAISLIMLIGVFGFLNYNFESKVEVSKVAPASLVAVKDNVERLKIESRNLAQVTQSQTESSPLAVKELKEVVQELTVAIQKEPELAKEVALEVNNNKTYLEIIGDDLLRETSDALYKIIDEQMIKDLENTSLTENQQKSLDLIKILYKEEKYTSALESILLLNMAIKN